MSETDVGSLVSVVSTTAGGIIVRKGGKAVRADAATIEKVGRVRAIREALALIDDPRTDIQ